EGAIGEMIIVTPTRIGHYLARFLVGDGRVIVPTICDRVYYGRPRERLILAVEVTDKRQIHRWRAFPIQVDAHMPLLWRGRPDPPDAARPIHLSKDLLAVLLSDDAVAVPIGVPVYIFAGRGVVTAPAVVTGPLGALLAGGRKGGEVFQAG